ncbi:MAG: type II secretion system F family protein [Planctomycetaceae bacterium]
MRFAYQARDLGGQVRDGVIVAETPEEVTKQLREEGMLVVSVDEASETESTPTHALFNKRVSKNEIIYLTNQLSVMIDSGVPLAGALASLAEQCEHTTLKSMLMDIHGRVESGEAFSVALANYPKQFDATYINLIRASEASGTMASMLERIANQLRAELDTRQKVLGAMLYPAAMLVMSIGICIFLLAYVFPKLTPMFETRNIELPRPTSIMLAISNVLKYHWHWVLFAVASLAGAIAYSLTQPWGKRVRDWLLLNVPIIGPMLKKVAISRSIRTLATTINAGVPVLEALELSAAVSNNSYFEHCWNHVAREVKHGRQIHEALESTSLFPATLRQMIASGEATGKLGPVLNKISDYYDREVATGIKSVTSLIEPLMVFAMGGIIGFIALAMLLPIFQLSSSVK